MLLYARGRLAVRQQDKKLLSNGALNFSVRPLDQSCLPAGKTARSCGGMNAELEGNMMREKKKKTNAEAGKKLSVYSYMEGAHIFDAKQALRESNEAPIGWYLQDEAKSLRLISNLLDPTSEHQEVRLGFMSTRPRAHPERDQAGSPPDQEQTGSPPDQEQAGSPPDEEEEWVGSLPQIEAAIKAQSARLLGWHLRELGDFVESLALAFDPPKGSRGWRLRFKREGRGRRRDEVAEMFRRDGLDMKLRRATLAAGKQEAAIEALKKIPGASRASLFRNKKRRRG